MKIAILGLCHSHPFTFAGILKNEYGIEISSVFDENRVEVERFQKEFPCKQLSRPEDVLKGVRPDAVLITTRTNRHYQTAMGIIEAGIPVFVDKPITLTSLEAKEMFDLADKNKSVLMSCSALRYAPSFAQIIDSFKRGEAGKPLLAQTGIFYGIHHSYGEDPNDWEYSEVEAGGTIMNYGIHAVEPLIAAFGSKVKSVVCTTGVVDLPAVVGDLQIINLAFESGAVAVGRLIGSTTLWGYQLEAHGTKASYFAPDLEKMGPYGGEAKVCREGVVHGYSPMLGHFIESIRQNKSLLPWEETVAVIKVLEAAKASQRDGKVVKI